MPAAAIQRAVTLFDPIWDLLLVPGRFRILHLLLESVGYDGSTGELELAFYPDRRHRSTSYRRLAGLPIYRTVPRRSRLQKTKDVDMTAVVPGPRLQR